MGFMKQMVVFCLAIDTKARELTEGKDASEHSKQHNHPFLSPSSRQTPLTL